MPSFTNQIANLVQAGPIVEISVGPSGVLTYIGYINQYTLSF